MLIQKLSLVQLEDETTQNTIIAQAKAFALEAGYPLPVNGNHFIEFWRRLLQSGLAEFFVVIDGNRVLGGFGGFFAPDPFSGELHASESFWFLDRSIRGTSVGLKLFKAFEDEAKSRGCKAIVMIHIAGLSETPLDKLYTRKG